MGVVISVAFRDDQTRIWNAVPRGRRARSAYEACSAGTVSTSFPFAVIASGSQQAAATNKRRTMLFRRNNAQILPGCERRAHRGGRQAFRETQAGCQLS